MSEAADADLNVSDEVASAVDLLVDEHGAEAAEEQLRERFKAFEARTIPALSYLRYQYGGELS